MPTSVRSTRSRTSPGPILDRRDLEQVSLALLEPIFPVPKGIRLLGVTLSMLNGEALEARVQLQLSV